MVQRTKENLEFMELVMINSDGDSAVVTSGSNSS